MQGKEPKILLVDDDQNLLTSLSDILTYKGFATLRAPTGGKALEIIADQIVEVALIDLRLEDTSGLELIHEVRIRSPYTECILLTGYASQESAVEAIRSGAFGYFQKPFDIDQVILSIQQAVQKSQAAKSLAFNERRLSALLENGRDNIVLFSAEGNLMWASSSVPVNWGYEVENIPEIERSDLLHPLEKDQLLAIMQNIYTVPGSTQNATFRLRDTKGKWRWVEGTAVNMLADPAVQGVVVNFRDITEQKVAEDQLRLHSHALNAAANAIVIADREGLIQWVNPAFESLTGFKLKEVVGENPRFLNSGLQSEQFYQDLWTDILAGKIWHTELVNKKKDGTLYTEEMTITPLLDDKGEVEYFIAIKQDVTARKQFEDALSHRESRYRSLFEESPVAILEEDFSVVKTRIDALRRRGVKDWRRYFARHPEIVREMASRVKIIDVNNAAILFHGAKSKQDLQKNLGRFFQDNPDSKFLDELVCFAEGRTKFHFETVNRTYDGRLVHLIIYWSVAPGHEEDLSKVIVSIVDISVLKEAEESLKRKQLLQEKIVALGRELAATRDIPVIYRTAEKYVKHMINCSNFGIILLDQANQVLTPAYVKAGKMILDLTKLPRLDHNPQLSSSERSNAIVSRAPRIINDSEIVRKMRIGTPSADGNDPQSMLYVPMLAEDQVIGLIVLQSDQQNAYTEEDGEWMSVVANQVGLAIQNARLHDEILQELAEKEKAETEIRRSLTELELLYENAITMNHLLDPVEIGEALIGMFTKHFAWHHAVIRLREGNSDALKLIGFHVPGLKKKDRAAVEKRFSQKVNTVGVGLSGWVIKKGQVLRVSDVNKDARYVASYPGIQSGMYVPIKIGNSVIGSIAIESDKTDAFSERDERLMLTIANQAAVAFDNSRLYHEIQRELEERKSTEAALRVSQERLQSILDNTNALIYIKDQHGRYLLVNNAMTRAFGLSEHEMIGKSAHELAGKEEADQHIQNDLIVFNGKVSATFEEFHILDGVKRYYISVKFPLKNEHGEVVAIGGISTDITEQKENEEQLRLLSYAVEQSPATIVLTDPAGIIEYVNKSFTRITGYHSEEILGKNISILQSGHTTQEEYQILWETIKAGKEWRGEFKNRTKTGQTIWESTTISPILNSKQETTHYLEIKEDISTRKEAEMALRRMNQELEDRVIQRTEELRAANTSLEKASRLKDEFLANMSHELRTPLTGVLGLSEALQKGVYGAVNEKQTSILNTIEEGGRHLLTLINDILDLSKIEAGKMELQPSVIKVDDICQSSLRLIKQIANAQHQKVILTQNPPDMLMYGDLRRLKQILVNLLGNAVKFTPENGELGLDVRGIEKLDVIKFSVWDEGIGISEENQEKLFQPFIQLESNLSRSYSGTGLGLSLVHRLAILHGGQVKVTSKLGEGSRFTVSIPWYKDEAMALNEAAVKMNEKRSKELEGIGGAVTSERVLVVEDNDVNRGMICDFLSFQGYQVISAQSGRKGMDLLVKEKPDLVLMDIQMPGIDGLEVIRTVRQMQGAVSSVPIIALTALAMPEDRQLCLDAGADDYLSKPIDLNGLLLSMKNLKGGKT
jgi:PAS domain S-box-containing protein